MYSYNRTATASATDLPALKSIEHTLEEMIPKLDQAREMMIGVTKAQSDALKSLQVVEQAAKRIKDRSTRDFLVSQLGIVRQIKNPNPMVLRQWVSDILNGLRS